MTHTEYQAQKKQIQLSIWAPTGMYTDLLTCDFIFPDLFFFFFYLEVNKREVYSLKSSVLGKALHTKTVVHEPKTRALWALHLHAKEKETAAHKSF